MKTNDIKKKVSAKVAKAKEKVAAKCGKTATNKCGLLAAVVLALAETGCHMGEIPTAQRAQTAATEVKFVVQDGGRANFTFGAEFVSLAQANETSGTETITASPSNTPTVDTKPDIDVTVPVNKENSGSSGSSVGALEKVMDAGADWAADKIRSKNETGNLASPSPAPSSESDQECKGCTAK